MFSKHKATIVREVGADHVICTDTWDVVQKVHNLTDGKGAHVILDSISGEVSEHKKFVRQLSIRTLSRRWTSTHSDR